MARLDERRAETLRELTVAALLATRAAYLATPGANALRHWDQIGARMRAAARTTSSAKEWATSLLRSLQIPAPDSYLSLAISNLDREVAAAGAADEWLDLVEREAGYLLAETRLRAEEKKARREAARAARLDPRFVDDMVAKAEAADAALAEDV